MSNEFQDIQKLSVFKKHLLDVFGDDFRQLIAVIHQMEKNEKQKKSFIEGVKLCAKIDDEIQNLLASARSKLQNEGKE